MSIYELRFTSFALPRGFGATDTTTTRFFARPSARTLHDSYRFYFMG